jgi:Dna[CI] antecedent, DciA
MGRHTLDFGFPISDSEFYPLIPPRHIPPLGPGKRSGRQRVLAQWRGVDLAPAEKARGRSAKAACLVLPKVLADIRFDSRQAEAEIVKIWNAAIDPNIAAHAKPTGLRKGTLFVSVDSNVWLSEIVRYRRKEILEQLQNSFGRELIARISFRVG